jgi:hypothetical protein
MALLATTRWLHIGNVNGFRYLGYAFTCPVMQAELIMMIAPVVPCYRLNVVLVASVTFAIMVSGYCASLMPGLVWDGDLLEFASSWDLEDLAPNTKLWVLMPSIIGISLLTFVQLPYMAILYTMKGGVSAGLPYNYRKLLLLVAVTWLGFPVWWFLNWQGMSIIKDAKLNGAGFCLLNIVSKGGFTLMLTSSSRWHKRSSISAEASRSTTSVDTGFTSANSASPWFVKLLRRFDTEEEEHDFSPKASAGVDSESDGENFVSDLGSSLKHKSTSYLSNSTNASNGALIACVEDACRVLEMQTKLLGQCARLHGNPPLAFPSTLDHVVASLGQTIESSRRALRSAILDENHSRAQGIPELQICNGTILGDRNKIVQASWSAGINELGKQEKDRSGVMVGMGGSAFMPGRLFSL